MCKTWMSAIMVFFSYCRVGYYEPKQFFSAFCSYYKEQRQLGGEIIVFARFGLPLGTMMCSMDRGWLPADKLFPKEVAKLRTLFGPKIGYFGKFAVWPGLEKYGIGERIFNRAVYWVCERNLDLAVMMVNPEQLKYYQHKGAEIIAEASGTPGLKNAPAVLLALKPKESKRIQRTWRAEQKRRSVL